MTLEFKPESDGTASIAKDGVDVINISASNVVTFPTNPVPPNTQIGIGQTWTNVIGSRVMGGSYLNNTGKPIQVSMRFASTSSGNAELYMDNVNVGGTTVTSTFAPSLVFVVPVGVQYRVTGTGSNATVTVWFELR